MASLSDVTLLSLLHLNSAPLRASFGFLLWLGLIVFGIEFVCVFVSRLRLSSRNVTKESRVICICGGGGDDNNNNKKNIFKETNSKPTKQNKIKTLDFWPQLLQPKLVSSISEVATHQTPQRKSSEWTQLNQSSRHSQQRQQQQQQQPDCGHRTSLVSRWSLQLDAGESHYYPLDATG